jgi:hypothetical protein
MSYYKPGFHMGPAGNPTGIGKPDGYMPTLDAAGKPFCMMSVDDYGFIHESYEYTNADHVRVFRLFKYSVPTYGVEPVAAAAHLLATRVQQRHLDRHLERA